MKAVYMFEKYYLYTYWNNPPVRARALSGIAVRGGVGCAQHPGPVPAQLPRASRSHVASAVSVFGPWVDIGVLRRSVILSSVLYTAQNPTATNVIAFEHSINVFC